MSTTELAITIIRGDDTDLEFTIKDYQNNAVDLTGGTLFFTVKKKTSDSDDNALIAVEKTSFNTPTTGICTLSLTKTQTDIPVGLHHVDVQFKDTSGNVSSSVGKIRVIQDVTTRIS